MAMILARVSASFVAILNWFNSLFNPLGLGLLDFVNLVHDVLGLGDQVVEDRLQLLGVRLVLFPLLADFRQVFFVGGVEPGQVDFFGGQLLQENRFLGGEGGQPVDLGHHKLGPLVRVVLGPFQDHFFHFESLLEVERVVFEV